MLRETITENGRVRGIPAADPRITAYKGIPFAAPPVAELRWRAPQPAADWEGERICAQFAPISMQETPGEDPTAFYSKEWHVDPDIPMSEDCLYLNVWTPAKQTDEKLPVMVWIFGGGMACGYPAEMEFDGERIARRGVVLVTLNYRVNAFGFLAHEALTREAEAIGEIGCNFGLLDQRAGIAWTRRNIANFGGDPDNITVFGQSAGGRSTWLQLCSPMNQGLFQKAIPQSGAIADAMARYPSLGQAEQWGAGFFAAMGVQTLSDARALPARVLMDHTLAYTGHRWGPVLDGQFAPCDPIDAIAQNKHNDVAILTGNTVDEGKGFRFGLDLETFQANARKRYGVDYERFMALAQIQTPEDITRYYNTPAFNIFELGGYYTAMKHAQQGRPPVYLYRFDPQMPGDEAGSFHSSDLWFVFETLSKCWRPFQGKHYDLSRQMCNYWTNFAKTGDPNGLDADGTPMETWRPATLGDWNSLHLGDTPHMGNEGVDALFQFELMRVCGA